MRVDRSYSGVRCPLLILQGGALSCLSTHSLLLDAVTDSGPVVDLKQRAANSLYGPDAVCLCVICFCLDGYVF